MKKKVLTIYGILMGMIIFLMAFQVTRYGAITGAGIVGSGESGLANAQGNALSIFEPSKMVVYAGTGKNVFIEITNSGTTTLRGCSIIGRGDIGFWIVPDKTIDMEPSETEGYSFNLKIPEDAHAGNYAIPFIFNCSDYWKGGTMELQVLSNEDNTGSVKFSSAMTGFSSADLGSSGSGLVTFLIIAFVAVLAIALYLRKKHKKMESISRVSGHGRKLIHLDFDE